MSSIHNLPNELLSYILQQTGKCHIAVSYVCHLWREIVPINKINCSQLAKYPPALMSWAISIGCDWSSIAYIFAAQRNNLDMIIWLLGYENQIKSDRHVVYRNHIIAIATENHNWTMLEFLMHGANKDNYLAVAKKAAELGMLNLLQKTLYLCEKSEPVMRMAIKYNQIASVKYLISAGVYLDRKSVEFMASIEMVQLCILHERTIFNTRLYIGAVKNNNLEMIKWLQNSRCRWNSEDSKPLKHAVICNNIEIIKYLYSGQDEIPWENAMLYAASCKHYALIKHIRDRKIYKHICHWTPLSVKIIIRQGNLEFIKWMVEDGCAYNPIIYAIEYEHVNILEYLVLHFKVEEIAVQKALKINNSSITSIILAAHTL